ncbi:FAD-dependent monooxygenase [Mobilicoccus sp.]|uniref:FAD-dependent monooxygenase n=1 Tax=Mobilicoccus sp. TaxID=2034349 RepID=UPI00289DE9C5|nr:FAD-dependent monooxygenase [Mobilicoccus sp.]
MIRVAIVGGSIAGLTLAGLLDPDRFAVTLHEERPERREAGSALGLWGSAWSVLRALGLEERSRAQAATVSAGALRDATGRALLEPPSVPMDLILRPVLVELLDSAVPDAVRRVDARVEEPLDLRADLVVGADGVRSVVRRSAFGAHLLPRPTPWLALRGLLDRPPPVAGEYWGHGDLAGVVPAPGGRTYWFTSHASDLGSWADGEARWRSSPAVDVTEALEETRRVFSARPDRAPEVLDALAGATPESTLAQRILEAPPLPRLVHGRAVLVGDAAHAMTPNLGRGACEAMADAHVLARELGRTEGDPARLGPALARYEARRLPAAWALPPVSHLLMRTALARRGRPARDATLRGVGRLVGLVSLTRGCATPSPS